MWLKNNYKIEVVLLLLRNITLLKLKKQGTKLKKIGSSLFEKTVFGING